MNPGTGGGVEWRHFNNNCFVNGGVMGSRIGFNNKLNVNDGAMGSRVCFGKEFVVNGGVVGLIR